MGESYYQDTLKRLAGDHGKDAPNVTCTAHIVLDDSNSHDPKAVAVRINGALVGHMQRDDARSFRRRLSSKRITGTTTCDALITGGYQMRDGTRAAYGVALDLKPFE